MPEPDATSRLEDAAQERAPTEPQPPAAADPAMFIPLLQAAALAFLALLAVGGVFLVVLKLQFPDLGAGADPVDVLSSVVIIALAILRVPVHLGDLTATVLPWGALVGVALAIRWACRTAAAGAPPRRAPLVGLLFGLIAALFALVFRLRLEPDAIHAGAFGAFVLGTLWVTLFAAVAFATRAVPLAHLVTRRAAISRERRPSAFEGARAGILMLLVSGLLGTAAGLIWVIVVLIGGGGPRYDHVGQVVAAVVYVAAFAPNLVVAIVSLSLGAPLQVGAGLTIAGRIRGNVRDISMFGGPPDALLLLILIPLVACSASGYWARRNAAAPERMVRILGAAAVLFAATLAIIGAVGDVRLGAQLASGRGFGVVAPHTALTFLLGLLWAAAGGYAGWSLAERRG